MTRRSCARGPLWRALSALGDQCEQTSARHSVEGERLVFTADVKGADGARMMYEVAWE